MGALAEPSPAFHDLRRPTRWHRALTTVAGAGFQVFALDVRGHGPSDEKGHIDHVGQLESDLEAVVQQVRSLQSGSA